MYCYAFFQTALKRRMDVEPDLSVRQTYNTFIRQLPVDEAAVAAPLTALERTLQRHKVHNRPPLPETRLDLVLDHRHSTTSDGRPFVMVDDGADDRIVAFVTNSQLQRFGFSFFRHIDCHRPVT